MFLVIAIFLLVEAIIEIRGKQFPKEKLIIASGQLIFWLMEIIFFSIFERLLPVIDFFHLAAKMFEENHSFRLVEANFGANKGFRKKRKKV